MVSAAFDDHTLWYVHIYIYIYVCVCVCRYISIIYVCMYVCMYVYVYRTSVGVATGIPFFGDRALFQYSSGFWGEGAVSGTRACGA